MANSNWLEKLYIALAVAGLAGTWVQAFGYLGAGFVGGNLAFWKDTVTTPAGVFIVVDIFVLAAAVFVLMFAEARRVGMRAGWAWFYFLGSSLIGISCFVPLYLAHRQRLLRTRHPEQNVAPAGSDYLAIGLGLLTALGMVYYSLTHIPQG